MHWELMQKLPGPFEHCQESVEHCVSQPVRSSQLDPELPDPDPLLLPVLPPEPAPPELPVPELLTPELPVPLLPFDALPEAPPAVPEPPLLVAPTCPHAASHAGQTPPE